MVFDCSIVYCVILDCIGMAHQLFGVTGKVAGFAGGVGGCSGFQVAAPTGVLEFQSQAASGRCRPQVSESDKSLFTWDRGTCN